MDHGELIRAAQQGEREAFDELVRQTYVDTFTLAFRLTGNEEDARDVAQDAYLRAWRGIGRFRGEAQFSTWMYRITANAASTHTRQAPPPAHRGARRPHRSRSRSGSRRCPARRPSRPRPSSASRRRSTTLPAKLRHVVVLKDVYGLSHEDIADELGISVAAAKVRLHRARRKLKDMLYEQGEESPCGVTRSPRMLPALVDGDARNLAVERHVEIVPALPGRAGAVPRAAPHAAAAAHPVPRAGARLSRARRSSRSKRSPSASVIRSALSGRRLAYAAPAPRSRPRRPPRPSSSPAPAAAAPSPSPAERPRRCTADGRPLLTFRPAPGPEGSSSTGRASVSKTDGWGFESLLPCSFPARARRGEA